MNVFVRTPFLSMGVLCPGALLLLLAVLGSRTLVAETAGGQQNDSQKMLITEQPTTFHVRLSDAAKAKIEKQLKDGALRTVRLRLRGMELPENHLELEALRVFVAKPDANVKTSIQDDHYATSLVLGLDKKQSAIVNIAPAIKKLYAKGDWTIDAASLDVTIVPVAKDQDHRVPRKLAIPMEKIDIEIP